MYLRSKRTTQHVDRLDKPVLDQNTFQQLLAAAYTLQEQNHSLVKEAQADSAQTALLTELPLESVLPQSDVEQSAPFNTSTVPSSRARTVRRPTPQSEVFFWRIATAIAMAAVSALLLVASSEQLSPLPSQLVLSSDVVQQQVPFWTAPHIVTDLAQGSAVGAKMVMMEPEATSTGTIDRTVDADEPGGSSGHQTFMNPVRHSIYESGADIVAPDTMVRYGRRAARR